jgi:Arc/MetJ family transcription regulator
MMATNLNLDDDLIEKAVALGGHKSKKDAVNQALREYVSQLRRIEALDSFGTFEFDPDYDYKRARRR